jgi:endonuclease/exonuclease/phosphatase family metal-dependent hydrolase
MSVEGNRVVRREARAGAVAACGLATLVVACGPAADADRDLDGGGGRADARTSRVADAGPKVDGAGFVADGHVDAPETLRLMTYNIRGAEANVGELAEVIRAEAPDIVALQEVDQETDRSGGVDQAYRIGQLTGMASSFRQAYAIDGGRYGLAVLSRYPIVSSDKVTLTSSDASRPRIVVVWQIALDDGRMVEFANTHLGLSAAERETQLDETLELLDGRDWVALLGDFNEGPDGGPENGTLYDTLTASGFADAWVDGGDGTDGYTYKADDPYARIDWIMLRGGWPDTWDARVVETQASDHLPVVADIPLN